MKKSKRRILSVLVILAAVWITFGIVDYARVKSFERPVFCILTDGADDGGSGIYRGLGYSFDIKGNFMPEDEFPGVTRYTYSIFGIPVQESIRD